jgi:hypothetical protein
MGWNLSFGCITQGTHPEEIDPGEYVDSLEISLPGMRHKATYLRDLERGSSSGREVIEFLVDAPYTGRRLIGVLGETAYQPKKGRKAYDYFILYDKDGTRYIFGEYEHNGVYYGGVDRILFSYNKATIPP